MDDPVAGPSQSAPDTGPNLDKLGAIDVTTFDWKAHESTYKGQLPPIPIMHSTHSLPPGRALITRLSHVPNLVSASSSKAEPTAIAFAHAALLRLLPHIRGTWDHALYLRSISGIRTALHPDKTGEDEPMGGREEEGVPDMEWLEVAQEHERREAARLDVELKGYISNLIQESIRVSRQPRKTGTIADGV